MKTMSLCSKPSGGCCPELYVRSDGSIGITDDYGGIVTMTKEQFEVLKKTEL
jgi:hypothetical protein